MRAPFLRDIAAHASKWSVLFKNSPKTQGVLSWKNTIRSCDAATWLAVQVSFCMCVILMQSESVRHMWFAKEGLKKTKFRLKLKWSISYKKKIWLYKLWGLLMVSVMLAHLLQFSYITLMFLNDQTSFQCINKTTGDSIIGIPGKRVINHFSLQNLILFPGFSYL